MQLIEEAIARQASLRPDRLAITHLGFESGGEPRRSEVTFGELHRLATAFAVHLSATVKPGQRVMLLHNTGVDFIVEFFGCLLAGAVPIPAPEPEIPYHRAAERLTRIVEDADVTAATIARQVSAADVVALSPRLRSVTWLEHVTPGQEDLDRFDRFSRLAQGAVLSAGAARRDDVAYLQYTSGSTGSPRGIEITHGNVLDEVDYFGAALGLDEDSVLVNWAPLFHDLGLVLGVLVPLLRGSHIVTMSPQAFVRDPERWLRAISDFGGTHSAAPNFAYDLCLRRIPEARRAGLRLDTWRVAINGAEPVRAETVDRFAEVFAPYGFRAEAMRPSYGLAECTLAVTTPPLNETPGRFVADRDALSEGIAKTATVGRTLVSCGRPIPGINVTIVTQDTREELPEDTVGEIRVTGWGVARGFHGEPVRMTQLYTGDLGFFHEGELYITGRRKDLIIVRGQNFHPVDLEHVAERADPQIRPGCLAAFQDGDSVGLVCEVRGQRSEESLAETATAIQRVIAETFQLKLDVIALVQPGSVPKTSSGKVRRNECGRRLASGELRVRYRTQQVSAPARPQISAAAARPMLRFLLGRILGVPAPQLEDDVPFADYGLDSKGAHELAGELERLLDAPVASSMIFDYPTISDLAKALESR
ncbi:AMP-binding protein [Streptosporangium carneum]|uniref:Acyl-CoA synthetase n=1 Tax=Streptosporangium carneum TaxID=47481 RepID=A0A9W6I8N0_9ACTN|nr:AMP-binding protein [Streptosporangium carneum]GLK14130.1 acyl-CoA synthetase [Streptosporangium carneum]